MYEGGIRIPMIVNWPGRVQPGQVNEHYVVNTDYFPTFLEVLGIKNTDSRLDGTSMLSTWEDASRTFNRGPAYWHYPHFSNQLGRPSGALPGRTCWRSRPNRSAAWVAFSLGDDHLVGRAAAFEGDLVEGEENA